MEEIQQWYIEKKFLFIIPLLFAVSQTRELHSYLNDLVDRNALFTNGTLADYILFATKGMSVYYLIQRSISRYQYTGLHSRSGLRICLHIMQVMISLEWKGIVYSRWEQK